MIPILLLPDSHKDIFTVTKDFVISYQASPKSRFAYILYQNLYLNVALVCVFVISPSYQSF